MLSHMLRAASKTPSVAYQNRYSSTTNASSYTFNTCAIGTADNSRLVVVQVHSTNALPITVSSLTIGGTAATGYENTSRVLPNSLWARPVSAGTTANIVVTFSGTTLNCVVAVYALYNLNSNTPVASISNAVSTNTTISNTIDAREKGIVIAGITGDAASTTTWTGVTEQYDLQVETDVRSGGNATIATTNASYSVQAVVGASGNISLAIGSWR